MIGSIQLPLTAVVFGGLLGMAVIAVQMLIGYRKIKFKGRKHWQIHKGVGWFILIATALHALSALAYLRWWPF